MSNFNVGDVVLVQLTPGAVGQRAVVTDVYGDEYYGVKIEDTGLDTGLSGKFISLIKRNEGQIVTGIVGGSQPVTGELEESNEDDDLLVARDDLTAEQLQELYRIGDDWECTEDEVNDALDDIFGENDWTFEDLKDRLGEYLYDRQDDEDDDEADVGEEYTEDELKDVGDFDDWLHYSGVYDPKYRRAGDDPCIRSSVDLRQAERRALADIWGELHIAMPEYLDTRVDSYLSVLPRSVQERGVSFPALKSGIEQEVRREFQAEEHRQDSHISSMDSLTREQLSELDAIVDSTGRDRGAARDMLLDILGRDEFHLEWPELKEIFKVRCELQAANDRVTELEAELTAKEQQETETSGDGSREAPAYQPVPATWQEALTPLKGSTRMSARGWLIKQGREKETPWNEWVTNTHSGRMGSLLGFGPFHLAVVKDLFSERVEFWYPDEMLPVKVATSININVGIDPLTTGQDKVPLIIGEVQR